MTQTIVTLPAFADLHVHFREPGFSYKETIKSGSRAAAAGGFSLVCTMPNLDPAPDSIETLGEQLDIIRRDACIDVVPFATITRGRRGNELVDYHALAPMVAGFSDDGSGVQDGRIMEEAMRRIAPTGKILAAHCEVNDLLRGGYIHDGVYARCNGHKGICSESEWREVERDIILAEKTGCRLHLCHMSTAESVTLIREAKKKGLPVTAETGPHYLMFCDEDLRDKGRFKMNPPLRGRRDMEALREGVADGTIDVIATDHAPHSSEEKSKGLRGSAMGVVGLETSFAAVYTVMVRSGMMSLDRLVEAMALAPRRILGIPLRDDDNVTVDLGYCGEVDPSTFLSMGKSTPFAGVELYGRILRTVAGGKTVYSASDETI